VTVSDRPTVVELRGISKRFVIHHEKSLKERVVSRNRGRAREEFWALRDVDLEIAAGTSVGLIGANGSGKSTLLKTIGGILNPTTGRVRTRGRMAALLELGAGFHPDLSGRENVYLNASILGLSRRDTDRYFDAIVDFSGVERFIDTQVKFYSSGMYVRLAFAVAVHVDPDILLVDEVLAVGDEPFQRKCLDRIRSFQGEGRTIVLVTHALDQMVDICDRGIVLEAGHVLVDGDPVEAARALRRDFDANRLEEQQRAAVADDAAPRAGVLSVMLLDASGRAAKTVRAGDPVRVRVEVRADRPLDDWVLGIGVDSPSGQSLWGTNTKLMERRLAPLTGTTSYEFDLGDLHVGPGDYDLHGAVATWDGVEIQRLPQAWHFSVDADPATVGPLGLGVRDVRPIDAPAPTA
jgi:ABC-2 type transport system ATP-binding protein